MSIYLSGLYHPAPGWNVPVQRKQLQNTEPHWIPLFTSGWPWILVSQQPSCLSLPRAGITACFECWVIVGMTFHPQKSNRNAVLIFLSSLNIYTPNSARGHYCKLYELQVQFWFGWNDYLLVRELFQNTHFTYSNSSETWVRHFPWVFRLLLRLPVVFTHLSARVCWYCNDLVGFVFFNSHSSWLLFLAIFTCSVFPHKL